MNEAADRRLGKSGVFRKAGDAATRIPRRMDQKAAHSVVVLRWRAHAVIGITHVRSQRDRPNEGLQMEFILLGGFLQTQKSVHAVRRSH